MSDLDNYRELLNVTKSASKSDIKKAYRQLAKQWHPDRFYQDPEKHKIAEEKFKEITIAYEYLIETNNQDGLIPNVTTAARPTSVNTEKTDPKTYYRLGVFLAKRGDLEESLDFLGKAIKLYPEYLEALEYRYQVLSELGFEYRAAADRQKIRAIKQKARNNTASQSNSTTSQQKDTTAKNHSPFKLLKRFSCASLPIIQIAVDHRRKLIPITNKATIPVIQLGSYRVIGELNLQTKPILNLDLHPKYNWIVTSGDNDVVQVFDLDTNQSIALLKKSLFTKNHPKTTTAYFLSEQGCVLLVSEENSIRKWNYEKNKILYEKRYPVAIQSTVINSQRTRVLLLDNKKTIRIHETSTGKLLHTLKMKSTATTLSFASSGNLLAIATLNKQIEIWNITQNILLHQFKGNSSKIIFLQFINSQKHLLSLEKDGVIKIFSLTTKRKPLVQVTHIPKITTCTLTDKERTLILGTTQGDVLLCRIPALT